MTGTVDLLTSRRILLLASNPAISGQTGWPIGFWWAELSHPYWEFTEHGYIEDQARAIAESNFIVHGRFRPHAVRDGLLITGQQQYSGAAAARLVIEALGQ